MSAATETYIATVLAFGGITLIVCLGLNLQFGFAGIINFGMVLFQAAGAYTAALLLVGPATGGFQTYIGGAGLPIPVAFLCATIVAGLLSVVVGLIAQRGALRRDYQALLFLVLFLAMLDIATNDAGLVDGPAGISGVPQPFQGALPTAHGRLVYSLVICGIAALLYIALNAATRSPWGRVMRAVREDEAAVAGLGRSVTGVHIWPLFVGGMLAGLSGALLVGYLGAWSPAAWQPGETFAFTAAIVVGGMGSTRGTLLGVVMLPVLLTELVRYLPAIGYPGLTDSLQWIVVGIAWIAIMWLRPRGVIPEARRVVDYRSELAQLRQPMRPPAEGGQILGRAPRVPPPVRSAPSGPDRCTLELSHVSRNFGGVRAVHDVSFHIRAGTVVGIIGPNGAGKTTLLSVIAGSLAPSSGQITFGGAPLPRNAPTRTAHRGVLKTSQVPREFRRMTVLENMLVANRRQRGTTPGGALLGQRLWWGRREQARVREAVSLLDLLGIRDKADELAEELSGGQKKLLELARTVMAEPRVLLLDEPTAGVSPQLIGRIADLIIHLRGANVAVLVVEHELGLVKQVCDSVIVMSQGELVANGTLEEVLAVPAVREAYVVGG